MKRRFVVILLLVALTVGFFTFPQQKAAAVTSVSKTDDEIVTAVMTYLNFKEGNCNSVNANDNGAVSIGMIQWHGTRALQILQLIVALIPDYALEVLGTDFYNEIVTSTNWSTRIVNADEKARLVTLLSTEESKQVQVQEARSDISGYLAHAKRVGLNTPALQFYFMDIQNQYGSGGAERMLKYAKEASGMAQTENFESLTDFHNGMRKAAYQLEYNNSVTPYMNRREYTYTYLVETLKWETNVPYLVMTVPNGTEGSRHISIEITAGGSFTFPACPYTREGYVFAGWNMHRLPSDTWFIEGIGWCTSGWIDKQGYTKCLYQPGQTQTADSRFLSSGSAGALYQLVPVWVPAAVTPVETTEPSSEEMEPTSEPTEPTTAPTEEPTEPTPEGLSVSSNGCTHRWTAGKSCEATCTSGAYTEYSCSKCGLTERLDTALPNGHTYGAWSIQKVASCEESGTRSRTCSVCGLTQTETVAPLGHQAGEPQQVLAATCTTEGKRVVTCQNCGKVMENQTIPATGHTQGATVTDKAPTCTESGKESACCTVCGTVLYSAVLPAQHTFGEWQIFTSATELGDGVQIRTCTKCSYTEFRKIAGGNHVHTYTKTTVAPTCTEEGYDLYTCACGDSYRENTVSPTGHDTVDIVTDVTCVSDGFTLRTCTLCRKTWIEAGQTALGHSWNSGKVTQVATADTDGCKTYTCTRCGAVKTEILPATGTCSGGGTCPGYSFTDMPASTNWAHAGLDFCIENGLLAGTSATKISPNQNMTRAMLVTVLYRLDGSPAVSGGTTFTDVAKSSWYANAVAWASSRGIVSGTGNNRFSPNSVVTREQLTSILYRYVIYRDYDFSARTDLSSYPDNTGIALYARESMKWAVGAGLLSGSISGGKTYLQPQGSATRAQVAAILMRFIRSYAA